MSDLFRDEAVTHYRQRLYGDVVLTQPATHWGVLLLVAGIIASAVLALVLVSIARKESVSGWVRPDRGIVHIQATEEGVIEAVFMEEGAKVRTGMPLMSIKLEPQIVAGVPYASSVMEDIRKQRSELARQLQSQQEEFKVRESRMREEVDALAKRVAQYRTQIGILERRIALSQQQVDQRRSLVTQGFISALDAAKFDDALLASLQAKEEVQQELLTREQALGNARFQLSSLPHEREMALSVVREKLVAIDQRLRETERRTHVVLAAPTDGTVSSLRVDPGQLAHAKAVLAEIVPADAKLVVELFVPTRAAGFLRPDMPVQIRYDAFPYQKYGVGRGTITKISGSAMDARELPKGLGGEEPVFRVLVAVAQQNTSAASIPFELRSGMTVKADLILERRTVAEFVFAPFIGAAGRGVYR